MDAFGADRVIVAPSCSLLHCPEDLSLETELDPELLGWLAFARQKLDGAGRDCPGPERRDGERHRGAGGERARAADSQAARRAR